MTLMTLITHMTLMTLMTLMTHMTPAYHFFGFGSYTFLTSKYDHKYVYSHVSYDKYTYCKHVVIVPVTKV